jgi:nitrogen fixation-related uncharacterized protein
MTHCRLQLCASFCGRCLVAPGRRFNHIATLASVPILQAATTLYHYLPGQRGGQWEEVSNDAQPQLYDANEDSNSKGPEWHLEVEGAQVRHCPQTGRPSCIPSRACTVLMCLVIV